MVQNISLIAAMSLDGGVIGKDNKIPWHIPEDLKYFKKITLNKPIIMGRKTFESIGKPLPKRKNIIITRKLDYFVKDAIVVNSIEEALEACGDVPEIMVIGGEEIYKLALPHANKMYITVVYDEYDGDVHFPEDNWKKWKRVSREQHNFYYGGMDESELEDCPSYAFETYERLK